MNKHDHSVRLTTALRGISFLFKHLNMKRIFIVCALLCIAPSKVYSQELQFSDYDKALGNIQKLINLVTRDSVAPAFMQCVRNSEKSINFEIVALEQKRSTVFRQSEAREIDRQRWSKQVFSNFNAIMDCSRRWLLILEHFGFDLQRIGNGSPERVDIEISDFNENFFVAASTSLLIQDRRLFGLQGPWSHPESKFRALVTKAASGMTAEEIVRTDPLFRVTELPFDDYYLAGQIHMQRYAVLNEWLKEVTHFFMAVPMIAGLNWSAEIEQTLINNGSPELFTRGLGAFARALNCKPLESGAHEIIKNYDYNILHLQHLFTSNPRGFNFRACDI